MAYQAKRRKIFREDFELVDENGNAAQIFHVELDPDSMAKKLSEKYVALQKAMQGLQNADAKNAPVVALETAGNAVKDILEAVFGRDDAEKIIVFYDERYMEMCREVLPFITQVVVPQVRRIARENKASIAAGYNRKQRRLFGRK